MLHPTLLRSCKVHAKAYVEASFMQKIKDFGFEVFVKHDDMFFWIDAKYTVQVF